jgi:RNA polymerase sigma-70 factor, ECF subfamily
MHEAEAMEMAEPDGRNLLIQHRDGDPDAFRALIAQHGGAVYGLLGRYGLTPSERDDVFQEVFVRVHRAAAVYREDRPLKPWLFTIAVNTARTWITRRRGRELPDVDDSRTNRMVDPSPDGARVAEARQTMDALKVALDGLPQEQRDAVLMVGVHQLPYDEAAETLGIPLNTLKSRLRRGRIALAEALAARETNR